jgi:hypothetical protein
MAAFELFSELGLLCTLIKQRCAVKTSLQDTSLIKCKAVGFVSERVRDIEAGPAICVTNRLWRGQLEN